MTEITGLVLAGGLATRMGGIDKGLVEFKGVAMAKRIADMLSKQCDKVIINANRNQSVYAEFGYEVVSDLIDGYQGPLSGFLSGLRAASTNWLITAPCDGTIYGNKLCRKYDVISQSTIFVFSCGQR